MIAQETNGENEMKRYLPKNEELENWLPADQPQYVKGEDLFLQINGGAEVYHEYGFKQAIFQGFKHKRKKIRSFQFNLEIYQMNSPAAAYGIYTFKTGGTGTSVDIGSRAMLEEYYLNFQKGSFLVTVIGFNPGKETIDGILAAARTVAAKIKETDKIPGLVNLMPTKHHHRLKPNGIKYLKGNLALSNHFELDSRDIFGLKNGVIGFYDDFTLLAFQYADADQCRERFENLRDCLQQNPHFSGFTPAKSANAFFIKDNKKKSTLCFKRSGRFILGCQAKTRREAQKYIDDIETGN
jgi:hypothetical protein